MGVWSRPTNVRSHRSSAPWTDMPASCNVCPLPRLPASGLRKGSLLARGVPRYLLPD
jgi:hypothetical protein